MLLNHTGNNSLGFMDINLFQGLFVPEKIKKKKFIFLCNFPFYALLTHLQNEGSKSTYLVRLW